MRVTEEGEDAPGQQLPVAAAVQEERISSIRFHQSSRISDVHCSSSSRIRDPSLDEDGAAGIQAASNPVRRKERERGSGLRRSLGRQPTSSINLPEGEEREREREGEGRKEARGVKGDCRTKQLKQSKDKLKGGSASGADKGRERKMSKEGREEGCRQDGSRPSGS